MGRYYILRDNEVVEEPDYDKWSKWYHSAYEEVRFVATTKLQFGVVETSFLALNMTLARTDPPMLFETRVKGGWLDDEWERYPTFEAARSGHEAWVARVKDVEGQEKLPPPGHPAW